MDYSVRSVAASCLGKSGDISIAEDIFGYIFGAPKRACWVRQQLELATGQSIDVNVILVAPGAFSTAELQKTQYALQFTRDAYRAAGVGIRKLAWFEVPDEDAGGYAIIDSQDEAANLTDDWSGPEGAIDLFVVRVMNGAYGWSVIDGDCGDHDTKRMSGSVVSLNCASSLPSGVICEDDVGTTFAHEMGHFLGLEHDGSLTNLMGTASGSVTPGTSAMIAAQRATLASHDCVADRC